METVQAYFGRQDTPSIGSPIGKLMLAILEKNPGMAYEAARAEAHRLQDKAAGRYHYSLPRVLSPEELAAQRARLRTAFSKPAPTPLQPAALGQINVTYQHDGASLLSTQHKAEDDAAVGQKQALLF
jgi:hypothetical protein